MRKNLDKEIRAYNIASRGMAIRIRELKKLAEEQGATLKISMREESEEGYIFAFIEVKKGDEV